MVCCGVPPKLLTTNELRAALDVSDWTLREWRRAGCPYQRSGEARNSPVLYDLASVRAWMSAQSVTGDPGRPVAGSERDRSGESAEESGGDGGPGLSGETDERLRRLAREADVALKQAKAEKEQLEVQKRRGELVAIDEVLRVTTEEVSRTRARFLAGPGPMSVLVAAEPDPRKCEEILEEWVRSVLDGLTEALAT